MLVVAVASVAFGAEGLRRRAQAFADLARHYRYCQSQNLVCGTIYASMSEESRRKISEATRKRRAYFVELERKYLRAARHPWEVVEPDPSPPDELLTRILGELTTADQW
jgi:hypothetical protein